MSDNKPNEYKNTERLPSVDTQNTPDYRKKTTEETLSLSDLQRPRRKKDDASEMVQKTTVISRDNPILKRALSHQAAMESEEGEAAEEEKVEEISPSPEREVILVIRGMVERVVMTPNVIYKLGRFELGLKNPDEIDLTPYGATDRGVSRLHAQMHVDGDNLYVTDLGSTNGTYLGGKRLNPDEPTAVKKGDELLLGRLAVQVMFR